MHIFESTLNQAITNVLNEEEIIKRYKGDVRLIANRLYNKTLEAVETYMPDDVYRIKLLDNNILKYKAYDPAAFYTNANVLLNRYGFKINTDFIEKAGSARAFIGLVERSAKKFTEKSTRDSFLKYAFQCFVFFIIYEYTKISIRDSGKDARFEKSKGNFEQLYDRIVHIKDLKTKFMYLTQLIIKYAKLLEQKNAAIDMMPALQVLKARDVELLAKNLDKIPNRGLVSEKTNAKVQEDIKEYYNYLIEKYYKKTAAPVTKPEKQEDVDEEGDSGIHNVPNFDDDDAVVNADDDDDEDLTDDVSDPYWYPPNDKEELVSPSEAPTSSSQTEPNKYRSGGWKRRRFFRSLFPRNNSR